jgi:hypothetical protein
MQRIASTLTIFATTAIALTTVAHAEPGPHHGGLRSSGRSGLTGGADLGFGHMSCSGEGCGDFIESGSFGLHLGAMVTPNIAILADAWWMFHTEDRFTISQGILTAAARFWPVEHFWLQAGLGAARVGYAYEGTFAQFSDHTEWVPAFQLAIGVEPIATDSLGLDIALRYGTGFYSDGDYRIHNLALVVGLSFY